MTVLAGLFLVAHGLLHLAIWLTPQQPSAPFDPHNSWLIADAKAQSRALAVTACALFVVAGILVLGGAEPAAALALAAAVVSLVLVVLTFNRWLLAAIAIDVAIIAVAIVG